jgi:hypothetical protein
MPTLTVGRTTPILEPAQTFVAGSGIVHVIMVEAGHADTVYVLGSTQPGPPPNDLATRRRRLEMLRNRAAQRAESMSTTNDTRAEIVRQSEDNAVIYALQFRAQSWSEDG